MTKCQLIARPITMVHATRTNKVIRRRPRNSLTMLQQNRHRIQSMPRRQNIGQRLTHIRRLRRHSHHRNLTSQSSSMRNHQEQLLPDLISPTRPLTPRAYTLKSGHRKCQNNLYLLRRQPSHFTALLSHNTRHKQKLLLHSLHHLSDERAPSRNHNNRYQYRSPSGTRRQPSYRTKPQYGRPAMHIQQKIISRIATKPCPHQS